MNCNDLTTNEIQITYQKFSKPPPMPLNYNFDRPTSNNKQYNSPEYYQIAKQAFYDEIRQFDTSIAENYVKIMLKNDRIM